MENHVEIYIALLTVYSPHFIEKESIKMSLVQETNTKVPLFTSMIVGVTYKGIGWIL